MTGAIGHVPPRFLIVSPGGPRVVIISTGSAPVAPGVTDAGVNVQAAWSGRAPHVKLTSASNRAPVGTVLMLNGADCPRVTVREPGVGLGVKPGVGKSRVVSSVPIPRVATKNGDAVSFSNPACTAVRWVNSARP